MNAAVQALSLTSIPVENGWYDLWHTHVDWKGEGNHDVETRRPFLHSLFSLFDQFEQQVSTWSKPAQVWLVIDVGDSSQSAVYLHTNNPNRDNFPYSFEGVAWGAETPPWLNEFINLQRHEVGLCVFNAVVTFWVRPRSGAEHSCALEPAAVLDSI